MLGVWFGRSSSTIRQKRLVYQRLNGLQHSYTSESWRGRGRFNSGPTHNEIHLHYAESAPICMLMPVAYMASLDVLLLGKTPKLLIYLLLSTLSVLASYLRGC